MLGPKLGVAFLAMSRTKRQNKNSRRFASHLKQWKSAAVAQDDLIAHFNKHDSTSKLNSFNCLIVLQIRGTLKIKEGIVYH